MKEREEGRKEREEGGERGREEGREGREGFVRSGVEYYTVCGPITCHPA